MSVRPLVIAEIPHPQAVLPYIPFQEWGNWFICGRSTRAQQGWKIYVSLTIINACEIIKQLIPFVQAAQLPFKYVNSIKSLRKLNAGVHGYSQIGKCFVIYVQKPEGSFIEALKAMLAPYRDRCPIVPCARPFGDDLPLYYRYGAYQEAHIELTGVIVEDKREEADLAVPPGIRDVFIPYIKPVLPNPIVQSFLLRYPVFEAISQQGKSGIFLGMNLNSDTFQEVVLKVGYHRGQVQPDGSDGCTFLRRELASYRIITRISELASVTPQLVDALDVSRNVILVLEYIPAPNLLVRKLQNTLTTEHLERCWQLINQFHASGIYLGDAKLANFLGADDGDVRTIDFEAAGVFGDDSPVIRTFFLSNPEPQNLHDSDRLHFLVSVLYPYHEGNYSWLDRHVDLKSCLEQEPDSETTAWALDKLQIVLEGG